MAIIFIIVNGDLWPFFNGMCQCHIHRTHLCGHLLKAIIDLCGHLVKFLVDLVESAVELRVVEFLVDGEDRLVPLSFLFPFFQKIRSVQQRRQQVGVSLTPRSVQRPRQASTASLRA